MELEYRKRIQFVYDWIEGAFEEVDPDLAEVEQTMGSLTITLAGGARCILSAQPSVQQLWLALAAQGIAYHFNYDESLHRWIEDKGRGIELTEFLITYLKKATGVEISAPQFL